MAQNLTEILSQIRGGAALEEAGRDLQFHRIVDSVKASVDHLTTVYGTPA